MFLYAIRSQPVIDDTGRDRLQPSVSTAGRRTFVSTTRGIYAKPPVLGVKVVAEEHTRNLNCSLMVPLQYAIFHAIQLVAEYR